jgi:5-methylcytosine-specific restriction endonuclease McrA
MRHSNPKGELGIIVERAMDLLLAKVEYEQFGKTSRPRKSKPTPTPDPTASIMSPVEIPAAVRREVAERDDYQCTYESADGHHCCAREFLQFDHVLPEARGGQSTVENLRLRCGAHNRLAAKEVFGAAYVEKRIEERRNDAAIAKADAATASTTATLDPVSEPRPLSIPDRPRVAPSECERELSITVPSERPAPPKPEVRAMREMVQSALVNMKFRKKDAVRALDEIEPIDPSAPIQEVILAALAVLT